MEPPRLWCRMAVLGAGGEVVRVERLDGPGSPDVGTLDVVARRALDAARAGGRLVLRDVDPELDDLLRLAGLPVEVEGQPERREEPVGVEKGQEERHLGDPAT